jgi:hypothetical protein
MEQLCAALKASAHVKEVNLEDCGVNACCVMLGEMLSTTQHLHQELAAVSRGAARARCRDSCRVAGTRP